MVFGLTLVDTMLPRSEKQILAAAERPGAVRALRSAVHGFAALEASGGFGLDIDPDVSFRRLVDALARGIA